ncbi:transcriptional regulator, partial [gut metagenome]
MKDRIRQLIDFTQMSQQDFANAIGVSPASLSSIFTGRTNPTNNHVQAIHRAFPEVNINWLLFGEGDMLLSGADGATADAAPGGSTAALADGMATGIGADSA